MSRARHRASTTVYPTDFLGNDRPITTVTERCQSGEFGRELRNLTEDPRSGTRSTTLQSISRGEPDPSLFQPPSRLCGRQIRDSLKQPRRYKDIGQKDCLRCATFFAYARL